MTTPAPPPRIRGLYVREVVLDANGRIVAASPWADSNGRPISPPSRPKGPPCTLERLGTERKPR